MKVATTQFETLQEAMAMEHQRVEAAPERKQQHSRPFRRKFSRPVFRRSPAEARLLFAVHSQQETMATRASKQDF